MQTCKLTINPTSTIPKSQGCSGESWLQGLARLEEIRLGLKVNSEKPSAGASSKEGDTTKESTKVVKKLKKKKSKSCKSKS